MQFFILVLLICLFVFLYCVYVLANDDFIFLRRDVTMEKLFNMIFMGFFFGLLLSRVFYGFSASGIFTNPLVFVLIPYFPGLSLLGGVVGTSAYLLFLSRRRENQFPLGRISDFFSIAFLISLPVGFLGFLLFSEKNGQMIELGAQAISYFGLFILFLKFLLPQLLNGKLKEGTITFLFLSCFSATQLIANAFPEVSVLDYLKNFENIISIIIFIISAGILVWYDGLLSKIKQLKKGKNGN